MILTSAQYLRSMVRDVPSWVDVTRNGDGTAAQFSLAPHSNVTAGSAFVPLGGTAWSATGCTYNFSGMVSFSGVISANSAFRLTYQYSVFSDNEVSDFLERGGTIVGGAVEAARVLLFDAMRCATWAAPDGTTYSNVGAQNHARQLYEKLIEELEREAISSGGFGSWSEGQAGW